MTTAGSVQITREPLAVRAERRRALVLDEWIPALESGEYTQGEGALRVFVADDITAHCCLGVLCDRIDSSLWSPIDPFSVEIPYGPADDEGALPLDIAYRYALPENGAFMHSDGIPIGGQGYTSLAQMNDGGVTFEEIVEVLRWIEEKEAQGVRTWAYFDDMTVDSIRASYTFTLVDPPASGDDHATDATIAESVT